MRGNSRAIRRRRGFTLTELMVVVFLLGMAISVFSASFPASGQALYRSRHMDVASNGCSQQLEFWKNVGYGSTPPIPAGGAAVSQSFVPPTALPGAAASVTFTHLDDNFAATTADTGLLRIDASITWHGSGNDRGAVSSTSILVK